MRLDNSLVERGNKINSQELSSEQSDKNRDIQLKQVSTAFASVFMKQVFKSMRETIPDGGFIDGGFSEDVFTDMLDGEISKLGSDRQELSVIGRLIYHDLKRDQ